ncbi:hypothetical protein I302_105150 [Kwoniella bestiolae CBS 10118]|uniref:Uncharacterized protein n=1 Tax=Kwoniella bestiolae CBS 10118 TaxID=1296100 RepID=A0AAJ8K9D5_9TREE
MSSSDYLSPTSANALISDLRPTTLSIPALQALNTFLDEILVSLISAAESINPSDLRKEGIPSVFSGDNKSSQGGESTNVRALGRSAVAEAEVELRSWLEGRRQGKGFQPDGQGNGMRGGRSLNVDKAVELLRLKCVSYSTMASQENADEALEEEILAAWKKAGGDASEDTVEPAALWMTAIIEHVCEHVLSQLASVVARDSEIVVAGPQELYTALCEDESVWGLFKKMKVKDQLEAAIRAGTRHKRSNPSRPSTSQSAGGRASPLASGSPHASKVSLGQHRDGSFEASRNVTSSQSNHESRSSIDTNRYGGIAGGVMRKGSQLSKKSANSPGKHHLLRGQGHERSGSVLSENTRSMLGAFHDSYHESLNGDDEQSIQEAQEEFDALVRSGETMKVSLTPSRLKNFDGTANRRRATESPNPSISAKSTRSENISPAQFPTPPSTQPRGTVSENDHASQAQSAHASPTQHSSPSLNNRPRADSAQRRLQARAASTIEENADEEELAGRPGQKKESLMELLASEGAYEPASPTKKGGFRSSGPEKVKRTVPAVVLGTPPPPAPESTFPSPSKIDATRAVDTSDVTASSSPSINTQSHFTSPQSLPQNDFSPQPTLTRSQFSSSSLNRPNGRSREALNRDEEGEDEYAFPGQSRTRKKTEAQELADFFNNTPPPASEATFKSQTQTPNIEEEGSADPPQTAKPGKGFRALVNKVTKSKKEKEKSPIPTSSSSFSKLNSSSISRSESHSTALNGPRISGWAGFEDPNSQPQLGSGGGMGMPKKQKSLHSLSTIPVAFRPFATGDDYDRDRDRRKGSNASRTSDAAREASAKFAERRGSAIGERRGSAAGLGLGGERRGSSNLASPVERRGSQPALHDEAHTEGRRASENRKMVGLGIGAVSALEGEDDQRMTKESSDPPVLGQQVTVTTTSTTSSSYGRPDLEGLAIPGSATSFKTAHSVISPQSTYTTPTTQHQTMIPIPSPVKSIVSQSKSTSTEDVIVPRKPTSETGTQTPKEVEIPTIPLHDLIPLRRLLDHATSAGECRLLLDAILSQYGVPRESPSPDGSRAGQEGMGIKVGPEDRVLAWLLAGRDGPVGDISVTEHNAGEGSLSPIPPLQSDQTEAIPRSQDGTTIPRTNQQEIFSESEHENTIMDYETETDNETGVVVARTERSPIKVVRGRRGEGGIMA